MREIIFTDLLSCVFKCSGLRFLELFPTICTKHKWKRTRWRRMQLIYNFLELKDPQLTIFNRQSSIVQTIPQKVYLLYSLTHLWWLEWKCPTTTHREWYHLKGLDCVACGRYGVTGVGFEDSKVQVRPSFSPSPSPQI